ncbi:hypothetical protein D3C85_1906720 [compost metagenome]
MLSTKKNAPPIIGTMAITHNASFQLMIKSKMLAPTIKKIDEQMETMACETNILIESASAVRLVNSFEGLA